MGFSTFLAEVLAGVFLAAGFPVAFAPALAAGLAAGLAPALAGVFPAGAFLAAAGLAPAAAGLACYRKENFVLDYTH